MTSPEPTSTGDAIALLKILSLRHQEKHFQILVNLAGSSDEAFAAFHAISRAAEAFGSISLDYLGYLPFDQCVHEAVRARLAFIDHCPGRPISRRIEDIAERLMRSSDRVKGTLQFFIGSLLPSTSG